jgi:protein-S-isoprenylcysteine O-methyltransferase Ste14
MWLKRHQIENVMPLIFSMIATYLVTVHWQNRYFNYLGIGIFSLGLLVWWIGKLNLDDAFNTGISPTKFVTTGIYSRIRHPIYIGLCLTLLGFAVFVPSIMWLGIFAVTFFVLIIKAFLEEKRLFESYGKKYMEHKKKTWF